jgi:hypothetical protein
VGPGGGSSQVNRGRRQAERIFSKRVLTSFR